MLAVNLAGSVIIANVPMTVLYAIREGAIPLPGFVLGVQRESSETDVTKHALQIVLGMDVQ